MSVVFPADRLALPPGAVITRVEILDGGKAIRITYQTPAPEMRSFYLTEATT